jgi:hypothetical protein
MMISFDFFLYKQIALLDDAANHDTLAGIVIDGGGVAHNMSAQHRRSAPASPDHVFCDVYVDATSSFYTRWGTGATQVVHSMPIIRCIQVSGYRSSYCLSHSLSHIHFLFIYLLIALLVFLHCSCVITWILSAVI